MKTKNTKKCIKFKILAPLGPILKKQKDNPVKFVSLKLIEKHWLFSKTRLKKFAREMTRKKKFSCYPGLIRVKKHHHI
jgi:hypothetical protein